MEKQNGKAEIIYMKRPPSHGVTYHLARFFFRNLFTLWGLRIHGLENLPPAGPIILAANHVSLYDGPLLGSVTPKTMTAMGKAELFRTDTLKHKISAKLMRGIAVFPSHRGRADRWALHQAKESLNRGETLVIFPEGTRSEDGRLGQAKSGFGLICHQNKVPVVPVFIKGTESSLSPLHKGIRPVMVDLFYGEPLSFDELYDQPLGEVCDLYGNRVMEAITKMKAAQEK